MFQSKEYLLEESSYLPLFNRCDLILDRFLGSGAFGEVYEGKATGLKGHSEPARVAVKVGQLLAEVTHTCLAAVHHLGSLCRC